LNGSEREGERVTKCAALEAAERTAATAKSHPEQKAPVGYTRDSVG